MSNFSLSKSIEKVLPTSIDDTFGNTFFVNSDFRVILKIFRLIEDDNILSQQKPFLLCKYFYVDNIPLNGIDGFYSFVSNENEQEDSKKQSTQFCYEFDADVIYTSFLKEYGLDLLRTPYLHWYDFQVMLFNLSDKSAFMKRIQLRFLDLKAFKGKDLTDMRYAKKSVQIPIKYTREEQKLLKEMEEKLRR